MMRISPLGIFGARHDLADVAAWAQQDAALTHPNPVCRQANALFAMAIADAVRSARSAVEVHHRIAEWAKQNEVDAALLDVIRMSASFPPAENVRQRGWVLIAFHNALWQLLHGPTLEEAVVDTVMRGGDTDTNAAICGALLGAVHGREAIPDSWTDCLRNCRPLAGQAHVAHPRPRQFWPVDALELAESLIRKEKG
jgi:ADP-ribosylglycohydrolase